MPHDPDDVELDKLRVEPVETDVPSRRRPVVLIATLALLVLALAAGVLYLRRAPKDTRPDATAKPSAAAAAKMQSEPGEQIPLPPLDETDPLVRDLVRRISSNPTVAAWLTTDGLILNFVVVTAKIANGESPASELKAVGPLPRFSVRERDGVYIDPSSYHRYDRYAAAVSGLDPRATARLYATLKPRILEAYKRLGPSAVEFDQVLERAIVELLRVPIEERTAVAVEPHGIGYAFADPRLQSLSGAQKQLLRMGPQNARIVQSKLREIAPFLGIPPSRLP